MLFSGIFSRSLEWINISCVGKEKLLGYVSLGFIFFFLGGGGLTKDLSLVELERDIVAGPQYEEQEKELNLELLAGQEWGLERE